ncbi:MAG: D-alanyl-D-alanine carboxypeptidase [Chitinophagaceae bacterium]|nr:D-alanyl-D-alanine carboxypeptidase [Chitinophagaceae bacterium]MCW5925891.1 D-alanyl-D-alanine carboxypeptidase [Chitinophagaceae bacterium]
MLHHTNSVKTALVFLALGLLTSCTASRNVQQKVIDSIVADSTLQDAHVGIAVYDPGKKEFIYQHQANKYFVPASNMKIISLYAGLKYLPEKLEGIYYRETADTIYIQPTGDPTFLHPDFSEQPVLDFLRKQDKPIAVNNGTWSSAALGRGWAWSDYGAGYMAERSVFPVYGNVIRWTQTRDSGSLRALVQQEAFIYSEPDIDWKVRFSTDTAAESFSVSRAYNDNEFFITQGKETNITREVAFLTDGLKSSLELLGNELEKEVFTTTTPVVSGTVIYSQPADSMFKRMMYRSDNFYAEQTLLMAAGKKLGVMDERKMIQYMLANDFTGFPQRPGWADGSGLSRYNLFTPRDFVWILDKLQQEYGLERMKDLFPTGGTGTLQNYYLSETPYIFAKTGTLSGVVSLSGYLYTHSGKPLIFSVLVNGNMQSAVAVRRKIEAFLNSLR